MLEPHPNVFIWTLINFFILLFIVHKYALPPFYKILDEREKKRKNLEEKLQKQTLEIEQMRNEYKLKLQNIQIQATQIIKEANKEKEQIKLKAYKDISIEKQKVIESINNALHIEKKKFLEDMKESAVDLVIYCTKKIIKKELTQKDHIKLIRQNVSDLDNILKI